MSIESLMLSNHLILCLRLLLLASIFPSIRVFSDESALCIRWPNCWSFSFSISPSNEYSGLISFRIDCLNHLAVKGLLRVFSSTTDWQPSLWTSHMTTGKTIPLTIWTFVSKLISLFFNMLSGFVIAFLPRSKHLLISWLQSQSTVFLEPKKINSVTVSTFPPSICREVIGPDTMILTYFNVEFQTSFFILLFDSHQNALYFPFTFLPLRVVSSAYLRLF